MSIYGTLLRAGISLDGYSLHVVGRGGGQEAKLLGAGTSASRAVEDTAGAKFLSFNVDNGATSGSPCGLNMDVAMTGALTSGGGTAVRSKITCEESQANAYGAYNSVHLSTDKQIDTLAVATRSALHLPNSSTTSGKMAAVQAEIYCDGASSDAGSGSGISFFRCVSDGNSSGKANVDDDAFLFDFQGLSSGAAHLMATGLTSATVLGNVTASLKFRWGSTTFYLPVATAIS